jgi:Methyltransferase domain
LHLDRLVGRGRDTHRWITAFLVIDCDCLERVVRGRLNVFETPTIIMNIRCRICESELSVPSFSGAIFDLEVKYYDCNACGYVQTENPTWLDQAYKAAINDCDTGIMQRNQINVGIVLATLASIGKRQGRVVDCAGGYGILVRLLRDIGIEALWSDPYSANLLAVGFAHSTERADLVTAFEAFEHFLDPVKELGNLLLIAPNLLISTEIIPSPLPAPDQWWYYGFDHGQHIGFFRVKTLKVLAKRFGKHLVSDGQSYHLFTQSPLSAFRWRMNVRIARRYPSVFTRGLQSKVWSDFQRMSSPK